MTQTLPTKSELMARVVQNVELFADCYEAWHDHEVPADVLAEKLKAKFPTCRGGSDHYFGFTFDVQGCIFGVRVMVSRLEFYHFDLPKELQ